MQFQPGDRVRWQTTGDDGLPLVRYGFVGTGIHNGEVAVLLDDEMKGSTVLPADDLAHVSVTTVELRVNAADGLLVELCDDPAIRAGLVNLWSAEADRAGLDVGAITFLHNEPIQLDNTPITLARVEAGGVPYELRASPVRSDALHVRAFPAL